MQWYACSVTYVRYTPMYSCSGLYEKATFDLSFCGANVHDSQSVTIYCLTVKQLHGQDDARRHIIHGMIICRCTDINLWLASATDPEHS